MDFTCLPAFFPPLAGEFPTYWLFVASRSKRLSSLLIITNFSDDQKLLIYREHKKLAAIQFQLVDASYHFQIQVAKTEGQGELISGLIDGQGSITVLERKPSFATCPICLAAGTQIDTPSGPVPVQALTVGTIVWTADQRGIRFAQPLIRIGKTVVPSTHQVVHLVLGDGRQVWVSPRSWR